MAVKNTALNAAGLAKMPALVNELKDTIANAFKELQATVKEYNEKKDKADEIKKKCNDKHKETPRECYLECGNKIEETPEETKKWKAKKGKKPKKAKKDKKDKKDKKEMPAHAKGTPAAAAKK